MDDLSDLSAAYGSTQPATAAPPLTVTPHAQQADDLSDLKDAFAAPPPPKPSVAKDVAQSAGSGFIRGLVGAPFAPASIAKLGADSIVSGGDWLVRKAFGLGPASEEWKKKQDEAQKQIASDISLPSAVDIGNAAQNALTPYLHTPQTTPGKYAEAVGEFAPALAVNPESLASLGTVGGAASHVASGVVAPAVASEAAGQATEGTAAEPYARALGGIAGGVGAAAVGQTAGIAARAAEPIVAKGAAAVGLPQLQERAAGRKLIEAAHDPAAFVKKLDLTQPPTVDGQVTYADGRTAPSPDQILPGSQPTLYQLTGDAGIGARERGVRTNDQAAFNERATQQNAAQVAAASQNVPTGDPMAAANHFSGTLDGIHAAADQHIDGLTTAAKDAGAGVVPTMGPEAIGAEARGHLDRANQVAKAAEGRLHEAVDPDRSLASFRAPISKAASDVYGRLSPTEQAFITPEERTYLGIIQEMGERVPYQHVAALSSQLAASMRAEKAANMGSTPALRRMTQLMSGVKTALKQSVVDQQAVEAKQVAAGQVAPDATMVARLQRDADLFGQQQSSVASGGDSAGPVSGVGTVSAPGVPRATGEGAGPYGGLTGDPSVSGSAGASPAERQALANSATAQRKNTFERGTVGGVLAPGQTAGSYRLLDSAVGAKLFPKGAGGYQAVKAYHAAAGRGPEAVESMQRAAASQLRDAMKDGKLEPAGLARWKRTYADALRGMDEVSPGFSSKFDTAARATEQVLAAQAAHESQVKEYQAGAVGKIIGATSADEVVNRISTAMKGADRVAQARRLMAATEGNADARAGVQSAFADFIGRQMQSLQKMADGKTQVNSNRFRATFRDLDPALREVFSPEQMSTYHDIVADIERADLSKTNKASAGPGSAGDIVQAHKASAGSHGSPTSFLTAVLGGALAAEHIEHVPIIGHLGAVGGAALGGGAYLLNTLRAAGVHDIQRLVADAMLNPDRARQYLKRVSPNLYREQRIADTVRASFLRGGPPSGGDGSGGSPSEPRAGGPWGPAGSGARGAPDAQGRIEPVPPTLPERDASPRAPIKVDSPADLKTARARVNTEPTPAQAEAGNYRKGHVEFDGLPISIETPRGATRRGVGEDGKEWSVKSPADYGYFKGSKGADGDHVDTYIGRQPPNGQAHVIDQVDPKTGAFDEHKVVLGVRSPEEAKAIYQRGFSDGSGPKRLGDVTSLPVDQLKEWLAQPQTRPMSEKLRDAAASRAEAPSKAPESPSKEPQAPSSTPDAASAVPESGARAEAALALGREFDAAGIKRFDLSRDLAERTHAVINAGETDHGQAIETAALERLPKDIRDAAFSEAAQDGGGASAGARSIEGNTGRGQVENAGDGARPRGSSEAGQGARAGEGSTSRAYYPGGKIDVRYELRNLPDLVTSHDTDLATNPAYPAELQPRDRGAVSSREQIHNMTVNMAPERLGRSVEANAGAPIIGPDNVVESGNGRTLALRRAYEAHPDKVAEYHDFLRSQGFDPGEHAQPVLVAARQTPMDAEQRIAFAHATNGSASLRMGTTEQALSDSRLIDSDMVNLIKAPDANAAANRDFVRAFSGKLPQGERGGMITRDGTLSAAGVQRMNAAITAKAYGDPGFLARAYDHADPNIKAIAGALTDSAGDWARMRAAAATGDIAPEHDITQTLMDAVKTVMRARDEGRPPHEYFNQSDIFQGDARSLAQNVLFNDAAMRNAKSRPKIAEALQTYAKQAQLNTAGPRLFGDAQDAAEIMRQTQLNAWKQAAPFESVKDLLKAAPANQRQLVDVAHKIADATGTSFVNPGIKSEESATRKFAAKRYDSPGHMTDIVRGGFNVSEPSKADAVVRELRKHFPVVDEGWVKTLPGYMDRKVVVRFDDGQLGEVQFWHPELFDAKENGGGHALYEEWRALPQDDARRPVLAKQMQELYGSVLARLPESWKNVR